MRFALPLLAALTLAALASPVLAQDDGLIVYNAQHEALTQEWADGFTKETGIKVTLRNGSDTELGNQMLQEGAASPADLFFTENSPAQVLVDNAGLFEKLPQDILDEVPATFRPSSGDWVGIAARSTVFAYNTDAADRGPAAEVDHGSGQARVEGPVGRFAVGRRFPGDHRAMLSLKGEQATADWLKAMKDNAAIYRGNTAAMKGVNAGEVDGAVIYHYYFFGDKAKTGENSSARGAAFLQGPGSRARSFRCRVAAVLKSLQAQGAGAGVPQVDRGQGRPGGAAGRHLVRICRGQWRRLQSGAAAARHARSAGRRSRRASTARRSPT